MSRKSRVEAATLGSEVEVASVGWVVVAAMMLVCPSFQALSQYYSWFQWQRGGVACWYWVERDWCGRESSQWDGKVLYKGVEIL